MMEAEIAGKISGPELSGPEHIAFTFGTLPEIYKIQRDMQIRTGVGVGPWSLRPELEEIPEIRAPLHIVRDGNGPKFASWLVDADPKRISMDERGLREFFRRWDAGETAHHLVDLLVMSKGSPWERARDVVRALTGDAAAVPDEMLEMVRLARRFWTGVAYFGRQYDKAVSARLIRRAEGEWLFLPTRELATFLPGLKVPKAHEGTEYLGKLTRLNIAKIVMLDFYTLKYGPLFRVRF